jgi:hypothetical protein
MSRLSRFVRIISLLSLMVGSVLAQAKTEFSATVIQESDGAVTQQKIFVASGKMRVEAQQGVGDQAILILDFLQGISYVLMPNQKNYVEISGLRAGSARQMRFLTPIDPANPCDVLLETVGAVTREKIHCKQAGTESVNGRPASKWLATLPDGARGTVWIDSKLSFLARLEAPHNKVELHDIREGAQSPDLFRVPSGYSRMQIGTTPESTK